MFFSIQKSRERGNYFQRRENNNFNFRGRGLSMMDKEQVLITTNMDNHLDRSQERNNIDVCKICGKNNLTALKCSTCGTILTKLQKRYHKH